MQCAWTFIIINNFYLPEFIIIIILIVPDGVGHCEVIVKPLLAGDLMVDLQCIILHRGQPLVMCVRASAQVSHTAYNKLFSVHGDPWEKCSRVVKKHYEVIFIYNWCRLLIICLYETWQWGDFIGNLTGFS